MVKFTGKRVFEGYALAPLVVYHDPKPAEKRAFAGADAEFARFKAARAQASIRFDELYQDTLKRLGEAEANLFQTHKLMAEDLDFEDLVREGTTFSTAEEAVELASKNMAAMFEAMDDEYMKERSKDVIEVGQTIIDILTGKSEATHLSEPSIVICNDLPSSDLMKFDRSMLLGLILIKGAPNAHVSILARMLEIPSVCEIDGIELTDELQGQFAILDANHSEIILQADYKTITAYSKAKEAYEQEMEALRSFVGKPTVTKDGKATSIYCNIASSGEVDKVIKNDGEGIGLFRSEFIYLDATSYPSEDEQFLHYKKAVEAMKGKQVIIRTLDIGADKKIDYFDLPKEENPALGYRSIRICKDRPSIFLTQLCALYRASAYGNLAVMVPMIISLSEVNFVHEMCALAMENLDKRKLPYNKDMKIGIMVETPAAAVMADVLAEHVDFFSIGTNDLSQYTLAIDRVNPLLQSSFNPHHRAILRLIKMTVEGGHKAGIPVGICGELARDAELLPYFLALGVDELSVSPAYVLKLRKSVAEIDTSTVDVASFTHGK